MKNSKTSPPKFGEWILKRLLLKEEQEEKIGDIEEVFLSLVESIGTSRAKLWYWIQIIKAAPTFILNLLYWRITMFKNYLKITVRNILKNKGYSFINIAGLAIGMATCILILLWVQDEISFDRFHENSDDLYIVGTKEHYEDKTYKSPGTPPMLGPALKEEYPEIINFVRFDSGGVSLLLKYGEKTFIESRVKAADPSVFEMLTFPMIKGEPAKALTDPYSIVLTERMVEKYFGNENPIGKTLKVENKYDLVVTGILQNVPQNSTLQFDFLVPLLFIYDDLWGKGELNSWTNSAFITLVQLRENTSYKDVNKKIVGRIKMGNEKNNTEPFLTPFSDLYLYGLGSSWGSHIESVRMFSMIALFVLLIACINFMNLATARSGSRAREIGMRKVVGAFRKDIINQFYGESILLSFISLFFALVLVSLLLSAFNLLSGKELVLDFFGNQPLVFGLIGTALFTGIIAGSYPALFMSSFQPVKILKGSSGSDSKGAIFRKVLVVLQFTISIILIIGTIVIYKQLNFMRSKDLGFHKKNLVYFELNSKIWPISEIVEKEILQHPAISHASLASFTPIGFYSSDNGWNWEGKNPGTDPSIRRFCTDFNFLRTFKIQMAQGKFHSIENTSITSSSPGKVVINETFASIIGKQNPVGMRLSMDSQNYICIGVVKDFNFFPLYSEIAPLAIFYKTENAQKSPSRYRYMFMKVQPDSINKAVKHIERIYKKFSPEFPFSYGFLDETLGQLYNNEERLGSIIKYFAAIAIIISCLGLFGLASFMAEQRTREIGIRKVFGSSEGAIVILLSMEFMKWVVAANVIAWPIAYFAMRKVLQNYAYRIDIEVGIFLFAGLTAIVIALLTVSYKSIKAAYANPVDALKYE